MSKRQLLIIIGLILIVFLFLGIPAAGDKVLAILMGLALIVVAFKLKPETRVRQSDQVPFVEYKNNSKPLL